MIDSFRIYRRNHGHWDVSDGKSRLFRIRGGPGEYVVMDERSVYKTTTTTFKTLSLCMAFICDDLMYELIVVEGQKPAVIESWNVSPSTITGV